MPTYEYTCKRCGENIEVFQSFSEKPLRKHQECGGELQKVFHARGVVFKGSGFYTTDYGRGSGRRGGRDGGGTRDTAFSQLKGSGVFAQETRQSPRPPLRPRNEAERPLQGQLTLRLTQKFPSASARTKGEAKQPHCVSHPNRVSSHRGDISKHLVPKNRLGRIGV